MEGPVAQLERRELTLSLGVFLLVLACFSPALGNGLLDWDDRAYIMNGHVQALSLETIRWAFTEFHVTYWAPLTWLSFALDHAVWGLDPVGYHLTNDLLHALTAALFFRVVHRLLRHGFAAASGGGLGEVGPDVLLGGAALAALFFGIHPLRVESVAWAAERKDVLSMAFGMGAVLAYLRHAGGQLEGDGAGTPWYRSSSYWLALSLHALSLLSKATLVTLPVVLLIVDWYPLGRLRRGAVGRIVFEKGPFLALSVAVALVTARAMAPSSVGVAEIGVPTRLLVAFQSIAEYLRLTALPLGICPMYYHPWIVSLGPAQILAIAAFLVVSAGCLLAVKRWPALLAAWLVYLAALAPVLGLFQNGAQELAGRFTYFPSTALAALVGAGAVVLWRRLPHGGTWRRVSSLGALALLAGLSALTVRDIGYWRDDVALWSRVIEVQPRRYGRAYFERANALSRAGRHEEALADANEALAAATRKGYPEVHENYAQVARVYRALGDRVGAEAFYARAVAVSTPPLAEMYRAELDSLLGRPDGGDPEGSMVHAP